MATCDCRGTSDLKNYDGHMLCEPVVIKSCESIVTARAPNGLFNGYLARPMGAGLCPAILLVHDSSGWSFCAKEMARRLAYHGFATLVPNMHFAEGKCTSEGNAESMRAKGGLTSDVALGYLSASLAYLRNAPYTSGKVGCFGLSDGGTKAFLAACKLPFDAVACCYANPAIAEVPGLSCPFLGLEGNDNTSDLLTSLQSALVSEGKPHQIVAFNDAPRGFLSPDLKEFRPDVAAASWTRIISFFNYFVGCGEDLALPAADDPLVAKAMGDLLAAPKNASSIFAKPHAKPLWKLFSACGVDAAGKVSKDALMDALKKNPELRSELGFSEDVPDTFFDGLFKDADSGIDPTVTFQELEQFYEGMHDGLKALTDVASCDDLDKLDAALNLAKKLGLTGSEEFEKAQAQKAKVLEAIAADALKKEKEKALAALKDAAASGDIDELDAAMDAARKLGLNGTSAFEAAAAEKARVALSAAVAAGDLEALEAAIANAKGLGLTGSDEFDNARRKKAMLRKPELKPNATYSDTQADLLWQLFTACDKEDLGKISQRALVGELERQPDLGAALGFPTNVAGFFDDLFKDASSDQDPVLTYAALEDFYESMQSGLKALQDATDSGDIDKLEAAIDAAKKLGLTDSDEYEAARAKKVKRLQELKAEAERKQKEEALAALTEAASSGDLDKLEAAIATAKALGLTGSDEFDAARMKKGQLRTPAAKPGRSYSENQGGLLWQLFTLCDKEDLGKISRAALLLGARENSQLRGDLGLPEDISSLAGFNELFADATFEEDPCLTYDRFEAWFETVHSGLKRLKEAAAGDDLEALESAIDRAKDLGLTGSKEYDAAVEKRAALRQPAAKPNRSYAPEMHGLLWKLFATCDKYDLGKISQADLLSELQKQPQLGSDLGFPDVVSPLFFDDLFKEASSDRDPVLTFDAFENWYDAMTKGKQAMPLGWADADKVLREFFQKCDEDDSKTISKAEFIAGLPSSEEARNLLGLSDSIAWNELDDLWLTMDSDESGELSFEELFQYYAGYWRAKAEAAAKGPASDFGAVLRDMREAGEGAAQPDTNPEQSPTSAGFDPVELIMKDWSVSSRQVYDDNLQMYDENLLKSEKALGLLQKQNLSSIKGQANLRALFEALPKIAEALDRLNRGVGGSHDFLHAAFDRSERIRRLRVLISAGESFDSEPVEWSVRLLMKKDPETAGEQARVRIVQRLIERCTSVSTIIYDHKGKRASSFSIRSVEESGINYGPNKALASLKQARLTRTMKDQSKAVFDANIKLLDDHLPQASKLTSMLIKETPEVRQGIVGRKQSLELFEHVAKIRDAMAHLAQGDHTLLISAFASSGGPSTRVTMLNEVLTGGGEFDGAPTGGIRLLMAEDPENIGQDSHKKTFESLAKSYRAAAGVAADHV